MNAVSIIFLALASLGTAYYIMSTLALVMHFRRKQDIVSMREIPAISVLKPVSGSDTGAETNFESILHQDYPSYEVIFGVLDASDPAVTIAHGVVESHPNASLYVGGGADGSNNKVRILCNLIKHASGEIIVITDADTRVMPNFLTAIAAPFADAKVGMVTCMYRGIHAKTMADALEGLHMTCIFAPGVASANALGGIDFGLGAAIAIRRDALEAIGGFEAIVDYLADDFQIGRKTAQAGYGVELSDYVVDIVLSGECFKNTLARELRWSRTTRVSRPAGHFGLIVTFGFTYSVLLLLTSRFSPIGWEVFIGVLAIRMLTASIGALQMGDLEFANRIFLLPLRDLLSFGIWLAGYFSNKVNWRGRRLRVQNDGKMTEDM